MQARKTEAAGNEKRIWTREGGGSRVKREKGGNGSDRMSTLYEKVPFSSIADNIESRGPL